MLLAGKLIKNSKLINIIYNYWFIFRIIYKCEYIRVQLHLTLDKCKGTCEDPHACAYNLCETAKKIRDILLFIDKKFSKSSLYTPIRGALQNPISDWDDFVVDCEVASDKEIHSLLDKIADAIR